MSERCQTKLVEKFDNKNYIIYFGIVCTTVAVLYFYRFHFAIIAFSYVLGCLACYYGLNSNILQEYINKLKCHFVDETFIVKEDVNKGCETCGSKDCARHDSSISAEPWVGLQIHKQLDQAIEDFYNAILDQFINSWYSKITLQPFFVDELRHQLRYASACLLHRAVKINYSRFITNRLVPCALRHYTSCARLPSGTALDSKLALHPAAANRNAELNYLRAVTNAIMPYLLKNNDLQNSVFSILIREIFAGWVLLSLTDVLADPYILNTLVILATGDETMAQLPTTPDYKVEFLETFVRHTESIYSRRPKLLRVELDLLISEQDCFYAFMQFMKTTSHIHLLQFYNDIKLFQLKLLNPELDSHQQENLAREAAALVAVYAERLAPSPALGEELRAFVEDVASVKRLQTSRALFQAARQSHALLEKVMLPRFLHSEEFYKLLLGSRTIKGCQKQMVKKPHERQLNTASKIGRVKGSHRTPTLDGQVLESYPNYEDSEGEGLDDMDIMKYLEGLAIEESTKGRDLSSYKVVLTNVETKLQAPPRRGSVRVFTITVHLVEQGAVRLCTVERSEHDFHLLRSRLVGFHGDRLPPLPSRGNSTPLETLRLRYQEFIQSLLQIKQLQTSELLQIFLTQDREFPIAVQAAITMDNSTDLTNIYQSVTHRLRKEKGQHLESFLKNLLVSSDIERYQTFAPHGNPREVEEAQEVCEEVEEELFPRTRRTRNIHATIFGNNFDTEAAVSPIDARHQDCVVGFSQCLMYLLIKVVEARGVVVAVVGAVVAVVRGVADRAFDALLNAALRRLLCERRLAHLIRLGHGVLFNKKGTPRGDAAQLRARARRQLLSSAPAGAPLALGAALDLLQRPHLNKQLVYNLLDLCVMELFPELGSSVANTPSRTRLPKT